MELRRKRWMRWGVSGVVAMALGACGDDGAGTPLEQDTVLLAPDVAGDVSVADAAPDAATEDSQATVTAGTDSAVASDAAIDDSAIAMDTNPEDIAPSDAATTNPLGAKLTFATETITIASGKERQVCKTVTVPGDQPIDIVRIESRMSGKSHHFNLYKVIDGSRFDPVTPAEAATHDCAPASEQLRGDAAYIYGSATPDRVMETPAGVAFHLEPGQRLILEYHGLNYTTESVTGSVEVDLIAAAPEATIEHYADIMWMANWGFVVPQGETHSDTASCAVPYDVEVFSVMSHFHELGTNFEIEAIQGGASKPIYEDDDWAHPKVEVFSPPLSMKAGDRFKWTCTWYNWRDHDVYPNKESTDEMCMIFAAAYPKNSKSADPVSCNVLF